MRRGGGEVLRGAKRVTVGARRSGGQAVRDMTASAPMAEWQRLDVRSLGGGALDVGGDAGLVRAGKRRFLVHANYDALLHYNCAHDYAVAVGILAGREGL